MKINRRDMIKAGASAALGGLLVGTNAAQAQGTGSNTMAPAVPPLANKVGMRLATCVLGTQDTPTVVAVLDDGTLIDLKAEAMRQQIRLGFDPSSMLDLMKNGNAGLTQVHALITAAGAPIAPASPHPFTPRGLCVHGVTSVPTLNDGTSSERGRQ